MIKDNFRLHFYHSGTSQLLYSKGPINMLANKNAVTVTFGIAEELQGTHGYTLKVTIDGLKDQDGS